MPKSIYAKIVGRRQQGIYVQFLFRIYKTEQQLPIKVIRSISVLLVTAMEVGIQCHFDLLQRPPFRFH